MAEGNEHSLLIAASAKAALEPIGFQRKGRSRFWFSDEGYWILSVEFQPSGWLKGSYLNVGVKWLWHQSPGLDLNYRPVDFIPFTSAEQFAPLIEGMATRAAQEGSQVRRKFESLSDVSRALVAGASKEGWPVYHAAVAAGLLGDVNTARSLFGRLNAWATNSYTWQTGLKADAAKLAALLEEPAKYHAAILAIIKRSRLARNLNSEWSSPGFIVPTAAQ